MGVDDVQTGSFASLCRARAAINIVASSLHSILPTDCPLVLGGGIIRDAIMGGVPVDIDLWLPSNIAGLHQVNDFKNWIWRSLGCREPEIIFNGPTEIDGIEHNYRDMSNHWVIEFEFNGFKFNIMRTMTPWLGDSQEFFSTVMQNFDIDLCMFFAAAIPTDLGFFHTPIRNVILPSNIVNMLDEGRAIETFTWNRFRYDQSSVARRDFRRDKIMSRYDIAEGEILERREFVPTPVELSFVMEAQSLLPFPLPPEMADLRTTREAEAQGWTSQGHGNPHVIPTPPSHRGFSRLQQGVVPPSAREIARAYDEYEEANRLSQEQAINLAREAYARYFAGGGIQGPIYGTLNVPIQGSHTPMAWLDEAGLLPLAELPRGI